MLDVACGYSSSPEAARPESRDLRVGKPGSRLSSARGGRESEHQD